MDLLNIRTELLKAANSDEFKTTVNKHCLKWKITKKLTKHCSNVTFDFAMRDSNPFVLKMDHVVLGV